MVSALRLSFGWETLNSKLPGVQVRVSNSHQDLSQIDAGFQAITISKTRQLGMWCYSKILQPVIDATVLRDRQQIDRHSGNPESRNSVGAYGIRPRLDAGFHRHDGNKAIGFNAPSETVQIGSP
jgi:hypothetical protein